MMVAVDEIRARPMTAAEFDTYRSRLVREYAAAHVRAGSWGAEDAEARADAETDKLLPHGVDTAGMILLAAETTGGDPVGQVWAAVEHALEPGRGAWIYDIEVLPEQRGKGYGRALLRAAEQEAVKRGVSAIGLNVFGANTAALRLYESAGYATTSLQMRKELSC